MLDKASGELKDGEKDVIEKYNAHRARFIEVMDDDLNTADAISVLFELVRGMKTALANERSLELVKKSDEIFKELTDVLGLVYVEEDKSLDEEVEKLIAERTEARKNKDWATADRIRNQLKAMNIVIEDTPQGIKWHYANA